MSVGGDDVERGWDFEFVDYEPDGDERVVVIQSAQALDGKQWTSRDALLGWTTHRVTVPDGDGKVASVNTPVCPELWEELIERAEMFVEKFSEQEMARMKARLVVDAGVAVRQELARSEFGLHTAVMLTAKGFGEHHGLVTGLPRTGGRGRGIYSVMYWAGNSGEALVNSFHRRDLAALVAPREQPSMTIRR